MEKFKLPACGRVLFGIETTKNPVAVGIPVAASRWGPKALLEIEKKINRNCGTGRILFTSPMVLRK